MIFTVTKSFVYRCISHKDNCIPILLNRVAESQTVKITIDNLVSKDSLLSLREYERGEAMRGQPAMDAWLTDTMTSRLFFEQKVLADTLKGICSGEAPLNHNISLDITGIPDGEYVLILVWLSSDQGIPLKVVIKTL